MWKVFLIPLSICLLVFIWDRLTVKYKQVEQFNYFIGKPGVGKSILLASIAKKGIESGHHVFSSEVLNVKVKDKKTHKTYSVQTSQIDPKILYRYKFPPYSWVLIDEIGICFNNRKFKTFDDRLLATFKKYRHRHISYFVCSQSTDCDATIRRIVTQYWILSKVGRVLTVARRLICTPIVVKPTADSPASIQDDFKEDPKLMRPILGGMMLCWIPKYTSMYDSFDVSEDEEKIMDIDLTQDPLPFYPKRIYKKKHDDLMMLVQRQIVRIKSFPLFAKKRSRL